MQSHRALIPDFTKCSIKKKLLNYGTMHLKSTHRNSRTVTVHWTGTSMGRKSEAWHGSFPFDVRSAITPVTVKSCTRKSVDQEGDGEPHSLMLPWLSVTWVPALQQRVCVVCFLAQTLNQHQPLTFIRPVQDMKTALQSFLQRPPLDMKRDGLQNASVHSSFHK